MGEDDFEEELRKNLSKEIQENFSEDISEDFSEEDQDKKKHKFSDRYKDDYDLVTDISGDDYKPPKGPGGAILKLIITVGAIAAITILVFSFVRSDSSYGSIYSQGVSAFESANYERALELFQTAQKKEEGRENADISKYIADCYINLGKQDDAIETYNTALQSNPNNVNAVVGLCQIYMNKKDAESVNKILEKYKGTEIEKSLSEFVLESPKMTPEGGNFDVETSVTITGAPDCPIFFTTDGSDPDTSSPAYTKPILLAEGVTVIKAMSVNDFGIKSYITVNEYILEQLKPSDPVFSLDSGVYINGQQLTITAQENARIYYTINGRQPTRSSYRYYNPITLRTGSVTISAVAYDNNGKASSVVTKDYTIVRDEKALEQGEIDFEKYSKKMEAIRETETTTSTTYE